MTSSLYRPFPPADVEPDRIFLAGCPGGRATHPSGAELDQRQQKARVDRAFQSHSLDDLCSRQPFGLYDLAILAEVAAGLVDRPRNIESQRGRRVDYLAIG